jgi:hypothetical protein
MSGQLYEDAPFGARKKRIRLCAPANGGKTSTWTGVWSGRFEVIRVSRHPVDQK